MSETTNQAEFKGWAKVEVMGHQSHVGFCETQAFGAAVLFRIDRPEIPEVEETLTAPAWVDAVRAPAGTVVKRGAIPSATVLVGAGSIYRIIPCDEATAMRAIRESVQRPLLIVKLADAPALTAGEVPLGTSPIDPDDDNDPFDDDFVEDRT